MSGDRISTHEVRLILTFQKNPTRWLTNGDLAKAAEMSPRTARAHTSRLAELGVLDMELLFPANKFRLREEPPSDAREYLERCDRAREALGM